MGSLLSLIAALGAAGSVLALMAALARRPRRPSVRERLEMASRRRTTALEEELRQPLMERAIRPMLAGLKALMINVVKPKSVEKIARQIAHADLEHRLDAPTFAAARAVLGLVMGLGCAVLALMVRAGVGSAMVFGVMGGVAGYIFPILWLRGKVQQRQDTVRLALPDAIDLITLCLEAMPFNAAMERVIAKADPVIGREFGHMLSEINVTGLKRGEALSRMADRIGLDELRSMTTAVTQADKLGTPLAEVFRQIAEDMRTRRRLRAETMARQAPVKMMFPLVLLVFPPLFIVILGPTIPEIIHSVAPGMHL
jgi:tight adherence protein C